MLLTPLSLYSLVQSDPTERIAKLNDSISRILSKVYPGTLTIVLRTRGLLNLICEELLSSQLWPELLPDKIHELGINNDGAGLLALEDEFARDKQKILEHAQNESLCDIASRPCGQDSLDAFERNMPRIKSIAEGFVQSMKKTLTEITMGNSITADSEECKAFEGKEEATSPTKPDQNSSCE